jgi:hypothetical protein
MTNHIKKAFSDKKTRNWNKLYIAIDLHDTIIEGKYNLHNEGAKIFPNAEMVLINWTDRQDITLILWTSSHDVSINEQLKKMSELGIEFDYISENPEVPSNDLCNFGKKFYFNILLDDKAGFFGPTGWFEIEESLREIGEW